MRLIQQRQVEESPLILTELPTIEPAPGQVRLRVRACGVCHTDLHTIEGDIHPPTLPLTPGHQVVGVVDALGEKVDSSFFRSLEYDSYSYEEVRWGIVRGVHIGDRVGVPWLYQACGRCEFCLRGEENLCPNARFTGFHVDGGYAEYMLANVRYVLPIPTNFNDEQAAPLLCAGIIGYRSLRKADVQSGERLGLVGFGASAHLAIQIARYWRCEVYVFTRSVEHRLHAEELGAFWTGGVEDTPPHLLDRAVIFAPVGNLIPLILEKLRPGGTLAINAIHMSDLPAMPYNLIYGERTLRSIANSTYQDGLEFLRLAADIPVMATVRQYPLVEANQALLDLKHSRINGEAVLMV
jgi:propanol-preferring alcohol dehydrogenase